MEDPLNKFHQVILYYFLIEKNEFFMKIGGNRLPEDMDYVYPKDC